MVGAKEQQTDQPCLGHVVGSAIERTYNVDDRLTGDREAFDKLVGRNTQLAIAATGATLLRRAMKDPEAFDLTSLVIKPNGTACYEYRAKNSFRSSSSKQRRTYEGRQNACPAQNGNAFVGIWNKDCTVSGCDEIAGVVKRFGAQ